MVYKPISDYGIIGNMLSTALASVDGSIDWCCLPMPEVIPCWLPQNTVLVPSKRKTLAEVVPHGSRVVTYGKPVRQGVYSLTYASTNGENLRDGERQDAG